ncbi:hypothetical protein D9757_001586 [Collybiopsis confluens]|uniref:Uncharacterized protein n=1 Tax=Collybiopsis confluens TaxID=2823264 RepID=A0A8H5I064_9AGAR|nr:hypothetical protein D9757_001586 [Collybiopsis confluens]
MGEARLISLSTLMMVLLFPLVFLINSVEALPLGVQAGALGGSRRVTEEEVSWSHSLRRAGGDSLGIDVEVKLSYSLTSESGSRSEDMCESDSAGMGSGAGRRWDSSTSTNILFRFAGSFLNAAYRLPQILWTRVRQNTSIGAFNAQISTIGGCDSPSTVNMSTSGNTELSRTEENPSASVRSGQVDDSGAKTPFAAKSNQESSGIAAGEKNRGKYGITQPETRMDRISDVRKVILTRRANEPQLERMLLLFEDILY